MSKVTAAVGRVVELLEELSPSSWTADEFEDFLVRLGDKCGQYAAANEKAQQNQAKKGSSHRSTGEGEKEEEEEEVTEQEAMGEVETALERLRQHIVKKYPYGSLEEPTQRLYEASEAEDKPGTKRTRTETATAVTVIPTAAPSSTPQAPVYAVDAFLYPEELLESLVSSGLVARTYCQSCGSTAVGLSEFITHSFSVEQLLYLSTTLLPRLADAVEASSSSSPEGLRCSTETVVDVGSRLGVVLWSCYFSARAGLLQGVRRVVGVELSARYCAVQRELAKRFCGRPVPLDANTLPSSSSSPSAPHLQLNVVESSCFEGNGAGALAAANVLILHNVFEYFIQSHKDHLLCWKQLRDIVSGCHGQLWITSPSLEETFGNFTEEDAKELFPSTLGTPASITSAKEAGQAWIAAFLDPIDVTSLASYFISNWRSRRGDMDGACEDVAGTHAPCRGDDTGVCRDHEDGCCTHAHSDDGSEDDAEAELKELIGGIYVYRVR